MTTAEYKQRAVRRNQAYVDRVKANKTCLDCGEEFPSCAMDFDHVIGDKKNSVSQLVRQGCSLDTIEAEIEKCEPGMCVLSPDTNRPKEDIMAGRHAHCNAI